MRTTRSAGRKEQEDESYSPQVATTNGASTTPKQARKRKLNDVDVKAEPVTPKRVNTKSTPKSSAKSTKSTKSTKSATSPDLAAGEKMADAWIKSRDAQAAESPTKKAERAKANPYGLSPGQSPYPTYQHPTPEECWDVHDRLSAIHGTVKAPKTVPVPSLNSSGCGEVPSVLDALIRTRLSAATNNENSSRAFRGLVEKFGIIKEGVGKGSVNWNKVRTADQKDVFEAIKSGGLADVKSRDIKKILQMVYEENQARKEELKQQETPPETSDTAAPIDAKAEVSKAEDNVISLDHLHSMDSDTAFNKLVGYPGVGPKTASCVLLFCMQRPSFAVDTHVFRLTRWLGWTPSDAEVKRMAKDVKGSNPSPTKAKRVKSDSNVDVKVEEGETPASTPAKRTRGPPPVTRNSTYAHLDVMIPDDLKYPLHYLFIKHGKFCPHCSAKKDAKIRAEWGDKPCPIKELKVGKSGSTKKKKVKAEINGNAVEDDEEEDGLSGEDGTEPEEEDSVTSP